jgi:predicted PurR-regulated permease PerM
MALGIPYSPVLGLLAGLTILLPFIGPIVSCSLTLLVTFALHSQSITLMVTIVLCYLVIHGIVEQLILFPALVGEALGLNSLETIIIVLLGGLVSGLAGAVFAVPVAAILKYLIPKIYQAYWRPAAGADVVPSESS